MGVQKNMERGKVGVLKVAGVGKLFAMYGVKRSLNITNINDFSLLGFWKEIFRRQIDDFFIGEMS